MFFLCLIDKIKIIDDFFFQIQFIFIFLSFLNTNKLHKEVVNQEKYLKIPLQVIPFQHPNP